MVTVLVYWFGRGLKCGLSQWRSLAEQGRPDPHIGGAHGDAHLEIPAHAHREPLDPRRAAQGGQMRKIRPRRHAIGWNTHQAHDIEPMFPPASLDEVSPPSVEAI